MDLLHYYTIGNKVKNRTSGIEGTVIQPGNSPIVRWDNGIELHASHETIRLISDNFIRQAYQSILKKINSL